MPPSTEPDNSEEMDKEFNEVEGEDGKVDQGKGTKGVAVYAIKEENKGDESDYRGGMEADQKGTGIGENSKNEESSNEVEKECWHEGTEEKVDKCVKITNRTEESSREDGNFSNERQAVQRVDDCKLDGVGDEVGEFFRSGQDEEKAEEEDQTEDDRDELQRDTSESSNTYRQKKNVEVIRKGELKEDEEGESDDFLDRHSLSQRKLTESNDEVFERCMKSEGEETEGVETEDELRASESEDAAVKVFRGDMSTTEQSLKLLHQKRTTPTDQMNSASTKPLLRAEDSEDSRKQEDASLSLDVKLSEKVVHIQNLYDRVSVLEKPEEKEETDSDTNKRHVQTKSKDKPLVHDVDRLVLHQSSPSCSSSGSSHSEENALEQDEPAGPRRSENSRGRLVHTSNIELENSDIHVQETIILNDREKEKRENVENRGGEKEETERVKRNIELELEGERKHMLKEKDRRIQLLQEELRKEEEQEERHLKEQSEDRLRTLRKCLLSLRTEEEARLRRESDQMLEELKRSAEREREEQQHLFREESKAILKELKISIEEERAAASRLLEEDKRQELERLKVESEEELQSERRRLQREHEDKVNSIKQEVKSTERRRELMMSPRPEHQLGEYHRELGEVLQEVREEVQRDHERKLEQLKDDHRREMNSIRQKYLDEETAQREQMQSALQDDREHLQASHTLQLEKLRLHLDSQIKKTQLSHSRKESDLIDLADQLELREKELKSQEALLQTKAADLRRRRQQLGEEEQEVDRQLEALPRLIQERDHLREMLRVEKAQAREHVRIAREERNEAKEQEKRLKEERDKAREECRRVKEEKERLQSNVVFLKDRCDHLNLRLSVLDQEAGVISSPRSRLDKQQEQETSSPGDCKESLLSVADLNNPPLSHVPNSHGSLDEFRRYISSHGETIQKTKLLLERESSRLQERQAALQAAAQSGSYQDHTHTGEITQEMMRSLQQEAKKVAELQQTVHRGNTLLKRKEEQLQELESSIAEEPLFDDLSQRAGERKVTFDVTESDLSSTVEPPDAAVVPPIVPARVQQLADSLQQISSQLNTVLGALGSLTQGHGATKYPTSNSVLPNMQRLSPSSFGPAPVEKLSQPPWAWPPHSDSTATPLFSTPISSLMRPSDELINSQWSSIFRGGSFDPLTSSMQRTSPTYSSYAPISEHRVGSMKKSLETDGQRLQGLIDGNKRWLEMRKKDTSIPLFTRYRGSSSKSGLVQLGLDDNNQIRVYHY